MAPILLPSDPKVRGALEEAFSRISPSGSAILLWERVFTDADRQRLGGDVEAAFRKHGTLGMWMQLHGVTPLRAILDVALGINLLSETDYRWLLREIGEMAETRIPDRPHWNHTEGKLYFGKKVIRRVRINKKPSNIHRILDAFQAANWARRVHNPLADDAQQLHETLRTLNRNLKQIRFHSTEGGQSITWTPKAR
jgi:hypothetical protein